MISDDKLQQLLRRLTDLWGLPLSEIAEILELSENEITAYAVKARLLKWSDQTELLKRLWVEGVAIEEIMRRLGRDRRVIFVKASRLKLPRRVRRGRRSLLDKREPMRFNSPENYRCCLSCQQPFIIEHSGNFICGNCRNIMS